MSEISNPFLMYGYAGPEFFCDREKETTEIRESLLSGNNITLMSPRRYGKSGLIHNAFHYLSQEGYACFYIDIYSTKCLYDLVQRLGNAIIGKLDTPAQRAEGFVAKLFRSCQITLSVDTFGSPQVGLNIYPQQEERTMEEIFAYIAQSGRRCFIAIDEFQQVAEYPEKNVEAILRTHVQSIHNAQFIFSGSKMHMMAEMFDSPRRPFYRSTERLSLGVLNESIYYDFARTRMAEHQVLLSEDVFHEIYQMVDGVTWYVQALLNRLYRMAPESVGHEHVLQALHHIVLSEEENYRRLHHLLTVGQASLLTAVAKEGLVTSPGASTFLKKYNLRSASAVQRALDSLVNSEYVYRSEEGYRVYDRFFAIWLSHL